MLIKQTIWYRGASPRQVLPPCTFSSTSPKPPTFRTFQLFKLDCTQARLLSKGLGLSYLPTWSLDWALARVQVREGDKQRQEDKDNHHCSTALISPLGFQIVILGSMVSCNDSE